MSSPYLSEMNLGFYPLTLIMAYIHIIQNIMTYFIIEDFSLLRLHLGEGIWWNIIRTLYM